MANLGAYRRTLEHQIGSDGSAAIAINSAKGLVYGGSFGVVGNNSSNASLNVWRLTDGSVAWAGLTDRNCGANGGAGLAYDRIKNRLVLSSVEGLFYLPLDANGLPTTTTWNYIPLDSWKLANGFCIACNGVGEFAIVTNGTSAMKFIANDNFYANNGVVKKSITLPVPIVVYLSSATGGSFGYTRNFVYYKTSQSTLIEEVNINTLARTSYTTPDNTTGQGITIGQDGAYYVSNDYSQDRPRIYSVSLENSTNQAPNTPPTNNPKGTSAAPAVLTTLTPTLDWSFSDPDAGNTQSAYQVRIKDAVTALTSHDTGKLGSIATDYKIPVNTLQLNKTYMWEVSTWDNHNQQSAWSSPEYFTVLPTGAVGDKYSFNYTGAVQTWQVPGNVTKVKLEAWGAAGANGVGGTVGGNGGYAYGELTVSPGEILNIYCGGSGSYGSGAAGGWNGGGQAGNNSNGSGGGASDVRRSGTAIANRVLVAGGGGGGNNSYYHGGAGGGLVGQDARLHSSQSYYGPGTGGTQSTGGSLNGSLGQGGANTGVNAGGGGGGYYGGGAGSGLSGGGGGGGSSYVGALENSGTTQGVNSGNGKVVITIVTSTSTVTFINRDPGDTDQATPEGTSITPTLTWDFSQAYTQTKYQVKIYDGSTPIHDSGLITTAAKSYTVPVGVLTGGKVYGWEVTTTDNQNGQLPSNRIYFITNNIPGKPIPDHIPDTLRVTTQPIFEATINDDVENDAQAFVLQLATDSAFTQGLQTYASDVNATGWEVFDGTSWDGQGITSGSVRPAQLVKDGGFEGSTGGLWKPMHGVLANGEYAGTDTAVKRSGSKALKIVSKTTSVVGFLQELQGWNPGDVIVVEGYVNVTGYNRGQFQIDIGTDTGLDTGGIVVGAITNGWQKVTETIAIPVNTKQVLIRVFTDKTADITAYVDDLTVKIQGQKEYKKVRYTPQIDLVKGTTYYWRMAAKDGKTGTMSEWTDQQTLKNLLGVAGNCENVNDWADAFVGHHIDNTVKIQGSGALKVTLKPGYKAGNIFSGNLVELLPKNKHLLMLGCVKNGNSAVGVRLSLVVNDGKRLDTNSDHRGNNYVTQYIKVAPSDYAASTAFHVEGFILGEEGQYGYFDAIRIYEITKAEYDIIGVDPRYSGDMLAVMYPYVDNTQTIQRKTRIRCGTTLAVQTKPIKTTAAVDRIVFSKFATLPISVPAVKRVEETDIAITYTGTWVRKGYNANVSGAYTYSIEKGASLEFSFIGTGIRAIGPKFESSGVVDIYLDGVYVTSYDQYAPELILWQVAYENLNLPYGPHKIKIVISGQKAATAFFLDHFEVMDTKAPAVLTAQASNNANDSSPSWEDVTTAFLSGDYYRFTNLAKTAPDWGVALKITVNAKDRLDEIELDAIGFSWD